MLRFRFWKETSKINISLKLNEEKTNILTLTWKFEKNNNREWRNKRFEKVPFGYESNDTTFCWILNDFTKYNIWENVSVFLRSGWQHFEKWSTYSFYLLPTRTIENIHKQTRRNTLIAEKSPLNPEHTVMLWIYHVKSMHRFDFIMIKNDTKQPEYVIIAFMTICQMTARKMDVPFLYMYILTTWYLGSAFRGFLYLSISKQFKKKRHYFFIFLQFLVCRLTYCKNHKNQRNNKPQNSKNKTKTNGIKKNLGATVANRCLSQWSMWLVYYFASIVCVVSFSVRM